MLSTWFDRIGDWNPQLFREIKGRLTPRNVGIVTGLAIVGQLLILACFYSMLPFDGYPNAYCDHTVDYYSCTRDAQGNVVILWANWWHDLFQFLTWVTLLLLTLPGVYLLALDLDREERQGTLNFIRLSPQSARSILMGKMLGVPVLVDFAVALLIPLHVWACLQSGVPIAALLSFYVLVQAGCFFLNSVAILGGFLSKFQAGQNRVQLGQGMAMAMVLITLMFCLPSYISWNVATSWRPFMHDLFGLEEVAGRNGIEWFYLPLWDDIVVAHVFVLANLALGSYWIWQAIIRSYESPGYTLLSKPQSYSLVLYIQVLILGFMFQDWDWGYYKYLLLNHMLALAIVNVVLFLGLIVLLSNQRQALLDWARFRHFQRNQVVDKQGTRRHSLWLDLALGEKSPANVAIALNLLIIGLVVSLWIAFWPEGQEKHLAFLGLVLCLNMLAIYGAIAQLLLMMKEKRRAIWAFVTVALSMGLPLALAANYFGTNEALAMQYLLFSPIPLAAVAYTNLPITLGVILKAILAQWAVLALLNGKMTQQLRQMGESDSKALLTERTLRSI